MPLDYSKPPVPVPPATKEKKPPPPPVPVHVCTYGEWIDEVGLVFEHEDGRTCLDITQLRRCTVQVRCMKVKVRKIVRPTKIYPEKPACLRRCAICDCSEASK